MAQRGSHVDVISFARHGQTAVNAGGRLQGRLDEPLSALGAAQAHALADAFASERVTRVISSPLVRARETAAAIAARHTLTVEIDERLIELDYGAWDGVSLADVAPEDWAAWRADPAFAPPDGESLVAVTARVASFFADALGDDLVVAVSHVSPIKAAVCCALGVDERVTWRMQLSLASVTSVGSRPDRAPYLLSYNETAHLAAFSEPA
jgi:broad specificity phosphatase PhoE